METEKRIYEDTHGRDGARAADVLRQGYEDQDADSEWEM